MGLVETFCFFILINFFHFLLRTVGFRVVPGGSGLGRCGPWRVGGCLCTLCVCDAAF